MRRKYLAEQAQHRGVGGGMMHRSCIMAYSTLSCWFQVMINATIKATAPLACTSLWPEVFCTKASDSSLICRNAGRGECSDLFPNFTFLEEAILNKRFEEQKGAIREKEKAKAFAALEPLVESAECGRWQSKLLAIEGIRLDDPVLYRFKDIEAHCTLLKQHCWVLGEYGISLLCSNRLEALKHKGFVFCNGNCPPFVREGPVLGSVFLDALGELCRIQIRKFRFPYP